MEKRLCKPRKFMVPAAVSAFLMTSAMAFADEPEATPGGAAISTIFNVLKGVANDVKTGLTTVVGPIAIAVCLYFLVRMLLASDPKDVTMYRKRCISTAIIVVVAFAIPGLISLMQTLGETINGQL